MPEALRFHKSLYSEAAIRSAAVRFAQLGQLEVIEAEADWLVAVSPVRESIRERLGDELANHALFETILERKGVSP
ncbi:MAG: hypothetical protein FJ090_13480 [Deltaproteobacteria bacterium]|nr:hypothetical protein [Deltaproteobacteria bacterium]